MFHLTNCTPGPEGNQFMLESLGKSTQQNKNRNHRLSEISVWSLTLNLDYFLKAISIRTTLNEIDLL